MKKLSASKMKNLCIIPARGGSKRIPRKNVKPFMGKPMLAYSIENALATGLFNEVMVSTDDQEIVQVAKQYGAKEPFLRSVNTSNAYAILADVIREVLEMYSMENKHFDNICVLLATSPLLRSKSIVEAYDKLISSEFTTILPVVQFSYLFSAHTIWTKMELLNGTGQSMPKPAVRTWHQHIMTLVRSIGTKWRHGLKEICIVAVSLLVWIQFRSLIPNKTG